MTLNFYLCLQRVYFLLSLLFVIGEHEHVSIFTQFGSVFFLLQQQWQFQSWLSIFHYKKWFNLFLELMLSQCGRFIGLGLQVWWTGFFLLSNKLNERAYCLWLNGESILTEIHMYIYSCNLFNAYVIIQKNRYLNSCIFFKRISIRMNKQKLHKEEFTIKEPFFFSAQKKNTLQSMQNYN